MNVRRAVVSAFAVSALGFTAHSSGAATSSPAPSCAPTVYPLAGRHDASSVRRGPGLVLSGAGAGPNMPSAALEWMRAHVGRDERGRAGNALILRASGERDDTDRFYAEGRFASVREILIPPCASRPQVDAIARYVDGADVVFFAGGDQAHYAAWKGSSLITAVRSVYARGGLVGGGSAGLAIQGAFAYDSVAADRLHPGDDDYAVTTANAARDPLEPEISFTTGLFAWPPLRDTITDTHFAARNRFGRLVAFLARIVHADLAKAPVYGLGIDEGSVVLVERDGRATLRKLPKSAGAYLVRLSAPVELATGKPLRATVDVARIARDGETFDLANKQAPSAWYRVTVDGERPAFYDRDPYR